MTQVSGVFYRLHNGSGSNVWTYVGAVIMLFGIVLETAADMQKNAAKKVNPRRLEVRQNKNYGNDPEYQKYVTTVPILLPFVPLYSVEKHKWLVA